MNPARIAHFVTLALLAAPATACHGRPAPEPGRDDTGTPTAPAPTPPPASPAPRDAVNTPKHRLDLTLSPDTPTPIPGLDLTATLVAAERLRLADPHKGVAHDDRAVIRLERADAPPVELVFDPSKRVHVIDGISYAVFGGTVLSIFPPGVPVRP